MQDKIKQYLLSSPASSHWKKIGFTPHHGICIPLFSLHTKTSHGIGTYLDLKRLIDWCKRLGFDNIQLLPINETTKDNSPYNALSSCALDPIYLTLEELPLIDTNKEFLKEIEKMRSLNTEKRVPYQKIKKAKFGFLKKYVAFVYDKIKDLKSYQTFLKQNSWVYEYALFRAIKEEKMSQRWQEWPEKLKNVNEQTFPKLLETYRDKLPYYLVIQYLCFSQMIEIKNYADKKNIFIIGDIPILISPDSVDVWFHRSIFDLTHVAGCPPDDFNKKGQKWGFPLFNWEAIKKRDYLWWKRRLNVATSIFHMYRIDHVVGFFRIWAMKQDADPTLGKFLPLDPEKWFKEGKERLLMMLEASHIFPIAEDLGLIPDQVYKILKELGISGTKVMRFQKKEDPFINIEDYEPISMTTTGTHDIETLQGWWQDFPHEAQVYAKEKKWVYSSTLSFDERKEILKDSHKSASIFHINPMQEYLALFPKLIWDTPEDERINWPGTQKKVNWTYRLRENLETILSHKQLEKQIKEILK